MRKLRKRQLGFLLNPFRFAGTVQSGALATDGAGVLTAAGAGVASAVVSADASAVLTVGSDQAASGAMSADGASTTTMVGAGIGATAVSSDGSAVLTVNGSSDGLVCDAADFDGTNDYIKRSSVFSPAAGTSDTAIFSCWFRADASGTALLFDANVNTSYRVQIAWTAANKVWCLFSTNGGGTLVLDVISSALATGTWYHVLLSFDASASARHLYINGTSDANSVTQTNNNIDWSGINNTVVGDINGTGFKFDGGLAEFYFAPGQYLDFSVQANREKFRTSGGKPANLGATGSSPTGTDPLIYLHLDDGETANNFAINRAASGNFTVTGALATYASSPSD